MGDAAGQQRGLGLDGTTGHAHINDGIRTDSPQVESRHIDNHIPLVGLMFQGVTPAATLHIDHDARTLGIGGGV